MSKQSVLNRINALNIERDGLYRELNAAMRIEQIWPDAFKDGMRCGERALLNCRGDILETWLCRADGETFEITLEQFEELQGYRYET